jgi:2-phosphosulfolactate phosphatase
MKGTVVIDCFPESAERYPAPYAVIAIDVIRATTTATTAVSAGRRVFPAKTSDDALIVASSLERPLLVGELGGNMPFGFDMTNSPAQIAVRDDVNRPMVLVSSSGTQLILGAAATAENVYLSCLRNYSALAAYLAERHSMVAVIGAGTRGQFRREDQIGCAWLAEQLLELGFSPENRQTTEYVKRWTGASIDVIREGRSAEYLRRSGQDEDLEFVLAHVDDLATLPAVLNGEVMDASRFVEITPVSQYGYEAGFAE